MLTFLLNCKPFASHHDKKLPKLFSWSTMFFSVRCKKAGSRQKISVLGGGHKSVDLKDNSTKVYLLVC